MPWPSDRIPKYRKHRGSGQAVVTIAGRDYYLGPYGTKASRLEYDRQITQWLAAGRPNMTTDPDAITIVEVIARYLRFAREYYRKGGETTGEYRNMIDAVRPLKQLYGRHPAGEFGPSAFKAVRQKLIDQGLARTTINARMRRVARVIRWAAAEELIPASIPQAISTVPGLRKGRSTASETEPVKPVSHEAFETALSQMPEIVRDMARFQMLTGCRPAEVCIVRPCDIDRSGDVWWFVPRRHKSEHHCHQRRIAIGPGAQEVLRPYLLRPDMAYCFSPQESESKRRAARHAARATPLSCGNLPGSNKKRSPRKAPRERYDTKSYRQAIHRACAKAGISKWSPNQIRHTVASEIRRQFGLDAAQVILGHATADTTELYAQQDRRLATLVAMKVG